MDIVGADNLWVKQRVSTNDTKFFGVFFQREGTLSDCFKAKNETEQFTILLKLEGLTLISPRTERLMDH